MSTEPIVHKEPAILSNPFAKHMPDHVNAGAVAIESERAIAEAQGKLVIAKRFPRDQARAYSAIIDACRRPGLAEEACYSFPRGGQTVSGPSIRLAEMLAANWGNIDYGIRELSRKEGVSEMEAYCWDLETNTLSSQKFTVRHIRDTRGGGVKLTDERDIYELTANMGGRRLRARILAIIPADLIQAAVDMCSKTMAGGADLPIGDRIRNMVTAFSTLGVLPTLIEKRVGHSLDTLTGEELGDLRKIHNSIRDGVSKVGDWFGDGAKSAEGDEAMPGDPVVERPLPKPRSPKGASVVKENVPAPAAPAPAADKAPEPKPVSAAPAAAPVAPPAKVESFEQAAAATEAPKQRAESTLTDTTPKVTQRAMLNDGEGIEIVATIDAFKVVEGTRGGQPHKYITADIVSPALKGQASQTDGGMADGKPLPVWQLEQPVRMKVRGKRYKNGTLINLIESIELAEATGENPATGEDV